MQIRLHHRSGFVVMTTITFPPSLYHRSAIIIISGFWGFFSTPPFSRPSSYSWVPRRFLGSGAFYFGFYKLTRSLGLILQFPLLLPFGGNCNLALVEFLVEI